MRPLPAVTLAVTLAHAAAGTPPARADSIPEPGTTFYGKVLVPSGGTHHQLARGNMHWSVSTHDHQTAAFTTALAPIGGGRFSYSLTLPHSALAAGTANDSAALALPPATQLARALAIEIDGIPAAIVRPGSATFELSQALRATTHRLDLTLDLPLPDRDGDGIADWWEQDTGLDPLDPHDAARDPDGDGLANLGEFLAGTDPHSDDRIPRVAQHEITLFRTVTTGVLLTSTDTDSSAREIRISIRRAPAGVVLELDRNPLPNDAQLTLADLWDGRVTARWAAHPDAPQQPASLELTTDDGQHSAAATIRLVPADLPTSTPPADGATVWALDGLRSAPPLTLRDGPDHVVITSASDRSDLALAAFDTDDTIDLDALFADTHGDLRDHVERTDTGIAFGAVRLALHDELASLRDLADTSRLRAGALTLPPAVRIAATRPTTSENPGSPPAEFTLSRSGPTDSPLEIALTITGSATNGADFQSVDSTISIPAGASSVTLEIIPYPDSLSEPDETVEVRVATTGGIEVAGAPLAIVTIGDLLPELRIAAVEPTAFASPLSPATIAITRSGALDRAVLARLTTSGTATPGTDFDRPPSFVALAAGETLALLDLHPALGAQLLPSGESVTLHLSPDPGTFRISGPPQATVFLAPAARSFAASAAANPDLTPRQFLFPTPASAPRASRSPDGTLTFEFLRPIGVTDLTWRAESSADCRTWVPADALALPDRPDASGRIWARFASPAGARGFLRVHAARR